MAKKKTDKLWGGYKQYTLTDGTKFLARDDTGNNRSGRNGVVEWWKL